MILNASGRSKKNLRVPDAEGQSGLGDEGVEHDGVGPLPLREDEEELVHQRRRSRFRVQLADPRRQ